ncbi:MAG: hypothetical protein ABIF77_01945 [bacterium]
MKTLNTKTTWLLLLAATLMHLTTGAVAQETGIIKQQRQKSSELLLATNPPAPANTFTINSGAASYRNPGTARLYSFLLAGGGQFYNGDTKKGLLQLAMSVTGIYLAVTNFPSEEWVRDDYYWASYGYWRSYGNETLAYGGLALALGASVWSILDAGGGAQRANERNGLALCPTGNEDLQVSLTGMQVLGATSPGIQISLTF